MSIIAGKTSHHTSIFSVFIYILHEYWVLTESRIWLKLVLEGARAIANSIVFHEHTKKPESLSIVSDAQPQDFF